MRTTLKDLLHAINILGDDYDVLIDGQAAIAVCPPIKFTDEGLKHFKKALGSTVEVEYKNDCHYNTYISDDEEDVNGEAWNLLASLAGYCANSKFQIWFEGDAAKMI